jgi:hypothetical protein
MAIGLGTHWVVYCSIGVFLKALSEIFKGGVNLLKFLRNWFF